MSVNPRSIKAGKCFATPTNQVRRVIEITAGGRVRYQSRGSSFSQGEKLWGPRQETSRDKFAAEVDREVTCDWDKDYPERKP